jgi:hypothetical protein
MSDAPPHIYQRGCGSSSNAEGGVSWSSGGVVGRDGYRAPRGYLRRATANRLRGRLSRLISSMDQKLRRGSGQ